MHAGPCVKSLLPPSPLLFKRCSSKVVCGGGGGASNNTKPCISLFLPPPRPQDGVRFQSPDCPRDASVTRGRESARNRGGATREADLSVSERIMLRFLPRPPAPSVPVRSGLLGRVVVVERSDRLDTQRCLSERATIAVARRGGPSKKRAEQDKCNGLLSLPPSLPSVLTHSHSSAAAAAHRPCRECACVRSFSDSSERATRGQTNLPSASVGCPSDGEGGPF